jgi:hypothetical protein
MQLFRFNRRRSETLLLMIGQLVLIAYVFQVGAFDHWGGSHTAGADGFNVTGIAGTSAHRTVHDDHCHGGPAGCADAGAGFAQLAADAAVRLPSSAPSLALVAERTGTSPVEALISVLSEPPRTV